MNIQATFEGSDHVTQWPREDFCLAFTDSETANEYYKTNYDEIFTEGK